MRIHLPNQKKTVSEFRSSPRPLVHPHFVNVSASREGFGESAHCAGSTEPSSFVNLIKLYQFFMQRPIKLCRHERDNISGKQIEYMLSTEVIYLLFGINS